MSAALVAGTYRSTDKSERGERRRLQEAAIIASRSLVFRLLDELAIPNKHHVEAAQIAAVGVLVALERFDPTSNETFETVTLREATREIERWKEHYGISWRARRTYTWGRILTHKGKAQSITAWSRELGVNRGLIVARLKADLPIDRVLSGTTVRQERITWFRRAFAEVPGAWSEIERRAVDAFYFRNLSLDAVAVEIGIVRGTLNHHLQRAREILAEYRRREEGAS